MIRLLPLLLLTAGKTPFDEVCERYVALKASKPDIEAMGQAGREVFEAHGKDPKLVAFQTVSHVSPFDVSLILGAVAEEQGQKWSCPAWDAAMAKQQAGLHAQTVALWKKSAACFCGAFKKSKPPHYPCERVEDALRACDASGELAKQVGLHGRQPDRRDALLADSADAGVPIRCPELDGWTHDEQCR